MRVCLHCDASIAGGGWRCPACGYQPAAAAWGVSFDHTAPGGFNVEEFELLAAVESGHAWFRNRNRLITWTLQTYFGGVQSFLEVGCGTGFVLSGLHERWPWLALSGTDVFAEALTIAHARVPSATLYKADARTLPFVDEYDALGLFDVLEHIPEDEAVLARCHRALRHGGALLLTVPQHPSLWSQADEQARHQRRYTKVDLLEKMRRSGFEVTRTTSFVSLVAPALWLMRRARPRAADIHAELRLSPSLNRMLGAALAAERVAIRAGLSCPFGGSLLVAARRR